MHDAAEAAVSELKTDKEFMLAELSAVVSEHTETEMLLRLVMSGKDIQLDKIAEESNVMKR